MTDPSLFAAAADPDPGVRERALDALGEQLTPEVTAALLRALAEDPHEGVRGTAAANLERAATSEVRAALIRAVETETSRHVRDEALRSLRGHHHPEVLRVYLDQLARPPQGRVPRQEIAQRLGDYDDERSVAALGRLLEDEDVFVRDWAAESLLKLNRPSARAIWQRALDDRSIDVRETAAQALAELDEGPTT